MILTCPKCGNPVAVNGLGRKPFDIPVNNVCDALEEHCNVAAAAKELNCSPGYIYNVLKTNRLKLKNVINKRIELG